MTGVIKDLKNQRFGRLVVFKYDKPGHNRNSKWWCKCNCGNVISVYGTNLTKGNTKSCGCIQRKAPGESAAHTLYNSYVNGAKRRSLEWAISKRYFLYLTKQNCYYCNNKPSKYQKPQSNNGGYYYNGIDRINNEYGYTINNVTTCCYVCNVWKLSMKQNDFINHCKKIAHTIRDYE